MTLSDARKVVDVARRLSDEAVAKATALTEKGAKIDEHQVLASRVAYAATEARAAAELCALTEGFGSRGSAHFERLAEVAAAELATSVRDRLAPVALDLGMSESDVDRIYTSDMKALVRKLGHESAVREIGRKVAEDKGRTPVPLDETLEQVRNSVRQFVEVEVAPQAEHIHRHDDLVPESFITKMGEVGYFGLSVPERYGGFEMGNLAMILTTEELSRGSLAGAGSLITRPEILAKALLAGGTEEQKQQWLPKIATGELMVGISVTEPNIGSDVASLTCRAERRAVGGVDGYVINGAKSWCTFAGRADILALLARTDPDVKKGAKGLSLFIVPKTTSREHAFTCVQAGGGRMEGKADRTPGYRGMHSFTLALEDYFVPANHMIGEREGEGRGFYLQMAGFGAGRLQTGGRATGVGQAALEKTAEYVAERTQFRRPIIEFQLTQYHLGRMAAKLAAARAITYAAALAMDEDERKAGPLAAQAKLFACDVAVEVTQTGQLLHGGWGYAEEYPISRYVIDAQVLPIFEGVKPILELKVVARSLLGG
ncbi:MAG TPA: acyl-CoA dehydrogenase family protein [Polyangiaceae bacterium]|nr:acyl-CoA dehydrogenase family protein [Polyangiaceae bacterium]